MRYRLFRASHRLSIAQAAGRCNRNGRRVRAWWCFGRMWKAGYTLAGLRASRRRHGNAAGERGPNRWTSTTRCSSMPTTASSTTSPAPKACVGRSPGNHPQDFCRGARVLAIEQAASTCCAPTQGDRLVPATRARGATDRITARRSASATTTASSGPSPPILSSLSGTASGDW